MTVGTSAGTIAGRRLGMLLIIAGGLLLLAMIKMLVFPGFAEFALITLAHLLLAGGVVGLALLAIRTRVLAVVAGGVWGAGWLLLHLRELVMLFFVLLPGWLAPLSEVMVLGGGAAVGVLALFLHRGSGLEWIRLPRVLPMVVAALSSTYLWLRPVVSALVHGDVGLETVILFGGDVVSGLVLLATGIALRVASRRQVRNPA